MAGGDERLRPATRNYVIFGLLLVVALALAARDHFGPASGRGEADNALRLLVVGSQASATETLAEVDGFSVERLDLHEALERGRELAGDELPAWAAVLAHADEEGYGFVVLDRRGPAGSSPLDWQLDEHEGEGEGELGPLPPEEVRFVVLSTGDLAREGPRMRWVELAPLAYESPLDQLDAIRLALYDHPDLLALWDSDASVAEVQAREVLRNRGLERRRESIAADQARWRELLELWPAPGTIAGSLAGEWEQVRAAPVLGGVLIEVRQATPSVDIFRHPRLEIAAEGRLYFVPRAALASGERLDAARLPCPGLPERLDAEVSVAPDGGAVVVREGSEHTPRLYAFDAQAAREGRCRAEHLASLDRGRALGRPNAAGRMAWNYDDDWLHWFEAGAAHQARVTGIHAFSGPWWVDEGLLAMIAERDRGAPGWEVDRVLTLLDVRAPAAHENEAEPGGDAPRLRVDLDAGALFGLPAGESAPRGALELLDLRPAGPHELLLLSESCDADEPEDTRPCLHRLRSEAPLAALLPELAARLPGLDARPYTLETLGPIGPYLGLAIAAGGGRALWVAAEDAGPPRLMQAELRGPQALVPRRVDADALPDAAPRISADAQLALSEVSVELAELGSVSIARAFVLPAAAGSPAD